MIDFSLFDCIQKPSLTSRYQDVDGTQYVSVSKIIEHFKQPFDEDAISKRVASKKGVTQKEILNEWRTKSQLSVVTGDNFHCYIEIFLKYERKITPPIDIQSRISQFDLFYNKFVRRFKFIAIEQLIADFDNKIVGIADCVCYDSKDDSYFILDWKTCEEIPRLNNFGNMKKPFESYSDSKFNHYNLQQQLLTKMCEKAFPQYKWKPGIIVHILPEQCNIISGEYMDFSIDSLLTENDRNMIMKRKN